MVLDEIIEKYGMHELDFDFCCEADGETVVYAYCHKHDEKDNKMINYFLKIKGCFEVIEKECDGEFSIHLATIEKRDNGVYLISGAGDSALFCVKGDLTVTEFSKEEYEKNIRNA